MSTSENQILYSVDALLNVLALVRDMRHAQRKLLTHRDSKSVTETVILERRVDKAIRNYEVSFSYKKDSCND